MLNSIIKNASNLRFRPGESTFVSGSLIDPRDFKGLSQLKSDCKGSIVSWHPLVAEWITTEELFYLVGDNFDLKSMAIRGGIRLLPFTFSYMAKISKPLLTSEYQKEIVVNFQHRYKREPSCDEIPNKAGEYRFIETKDGTLVPITFDKSQRDPRS